VLRSGTVNHPGLKAGVIDQVVHGGSLMISRPFWRALPAVTTPTAR